MSAAVVLDSTPLGILCHPHQPPHVLTCRQWVAGLLAAGRRVILPELADYEIRREMIRLGGTVALANLDSYGTQLEYLSINTAAMRLAAELWARARSTGLPTAPDPALDGDVILAAQALSLNTPVVVATGNPGHLARFVSAELWSQITP